MIRAATFAALLLGAAGCLGDLVKPPSQDGGGDRDAGPEPDAGGTGELPEDLAIRITTLVVDLNGNARPDLVLLNDPPTPADRGVVVYLDREQGFFSAPDAFLSTDDLHPLVATTGDFVGGAPLDLMVVANGDDGTPYLFVFENSGQSSFSQAASQGFPDRQVSAGSVDVPAPVFVTRAFIQGSTQAPPGVFFGDSDQAIYVTVDDWTQLSATDDIDVDVLTDTMNVALAVPSAELDRNDIVVLDNQGGYLLRNNGSPGGGFAEPTNGPGLWDDNQRAFFTFDFAADDAPDFITLDDQMDLRVGTVTWTAPDTLDVDVKPLAPAPDFGDDVGDALFVTDIDGISGTDILVLDDVNGEEAFWLHAARNVFVDESAAVPDSGRIDVDATHIGNPTRLVAGDFDDDGDVEVWVFDPSLDFKSCLVGEIYDSDHYRFNPCE